VLEFWGTCVFSVVTCISLTSTPKSILNIYDHPLTLRLVLFFNIVAASVPAVLVSLNYGTLPSVRGSACPPPLRTLFCRASDRTRSPSHDPQRADILPRRPDALSKTRHPPQSTSKY
jgi:hypothetical protein